MAETKWKVTAHLDGATHEKFTPYKDTAHEIAEQWVARGVWLGDTLYPPSRIISVQILEVKG